MNANNHEIKILLHIGNYKTGTSAMQNFLYNNRQSLLKHGIYYGNTWKIVNNHAGFAFGLLGEALRSLNLCGLCEEVCEAGINSASELNKMLFVAEERNAHTIIISHEGLFADLFQVSAGLFSKLKTDDIDRVNEYITNRIKELMPDAMVICYLRRQDEYIESMYKEYCKVPWKADEKPVIYDEFEKRQKLCLDYRREAARWQKVFGDKVKFAVYENNRLYSNNMIYDFLCNYAGLNEEDINNMEQPDIMDINVSLSMDALYHKLETRRNEPHYNYLYKLYSQEYPDDRYYGIFGNERRDKIISRYTDSNLMLFGDDSFNIEDIKDISEYTGLTTEKRKNIDMWLKKMLKILLES